MGQKLINQNEASRLKLQAVCISKGADYHRRRSAFVPVSSEK
jgi:hypothetical protein